MNGNQIRLKTSSKQKIKDIKTAKWNIYYEQKAYIMNPPNQIENII